MRRTARLFVTDAMRNLADPWESAISLAPMAPRKLLETDLQKQCAAYARNRGWWARKFRSMAQKSLPDYLFAKQTWPNDPVKLAVEFKIWPNVSTDAQWDEQYGMYLAGWQVEECNNFEHFKRIILLAEKT